MLSGNECAMCFRRVIGLSAGMQRFFILPTCIVLVAFLSVSVFLDSESMENNELSEKRLDSFLIA